MAKPINALLVVSDLHCGSSVGLAAPETVLDEGNVVTFGTNYHQEWLWMCWDSLMLEAAGRLEGARIGGVLNGDAIEGIHHRSAEVIAAQKEIHIQMAKQVMEPMRSFVDELFITKGTECHTTGIEHELARDLKAYGKTAHKKLLLEVNGVLIDIAHHMPTTGRKNLEASGMGIILANAQINYMRANQRPPRVFLRGHRHTGGWYSDGHSALGVTGGWQFLTRHGQKVVTDSIPTPYALILDWRGQAKGTLPRVTELRYDPPQDEIVVV